MKRIINKIITIFMLLLMLIPYSTALNLKAVESPISINQSVDEDLKYFNFDYERYKVDPELVYRPILINFNESNSKDYMDLIYVYDPNDSFVLNSIKIKFYAGSSEDKLQYIKDLSYQLYSAGSSEDKTIKRYALKGYDYDLRNYSFRRYDVTHLGAFKVESSYLFGPSGSTVNYTNCMNILLEDAHNWSWHFDEDTSWWENFKDLYITNSDVLHDQLFYSFYIPNKWDVKEIKSIDLQYKKVLLEGNRHNVADEGTVHEFYQDTSDINYRPKFYSWNDSNTSDTLDKSNLLGYSLSEIGNKVNYTYKTILPDEVVSNTETGTKTYKWKKIQNLDAFKNSFGESSEIYKFANLYFEDKSKNYWIINYDDFYYIYNQLNVAYLDKNIKYFDYLKSNNARFVNSIGIPYYVGFHFTEEYTFDIKARYITYEDSLGVTRSLPTSVAPVMEKEGSGGGSDKPSLGIDWEGILKAIKTAIAIVMIVLIVLVVYIVISKISDKVNQNELRRSIKETNKILKKSKDK